MKLVKFRSFTCLLDVASYQANQNIPAIALIDRDNGEEVVMATVYHDELKNDEVGIKNWSENEGVYEALVEANIIQRFHRTIQNGFIQILVCKLFDTKKDYMKNTLTWQAYIQMIVSLECLKYKKYPNGQRLDREDIKYINSEVQRCTEVLLKHNIELPTVNDKTGDQFSLFA